MTPLEYLTVGDVLRIHDEIILSTGGDGGVLLAGNLAAAVEAPSKSVFGYEPYQSVEAKGAALLHEISKLHPFVDGNKRTAYVASDTFLRMNGYALVARTDEVVDMSVQTARCQLGIPELTEWMSVHSRRL